MGGGLVIENLIARDAVRKINETGDSPQGHRIRMLSQSHGEKIQINIRNHLFKEVSKHGVDLPER